MALFRTIPLASSYFRIVRPPGRARLTVDMVRLNYGDLSPFPGGGLVYCRAGEDLLLWYASETAPTTLSPSIPEAYLIWRRFAAQRDAIVACPRGPTVTYLAVRDGRFVGQTTRPAPSAADGSDPWIELLIREHSLQDARRITVSAQDVPRPTLAQILAFAHPQWSFESAVRTALARIQVPLLVVLALLAAYPSLLARHYENRVAQQQAELQRLEAQTGGLKDELESAQKRALFWNAFQAQEMGGAPLNQAFAGIASVVAGRGGQLQNVQYVPGRIQAVVQLPAGRTEGLVESLLAFPAYQKANIQSNRELQNQSQWRVLQLELTLPRPGAVGDGSERGRPAE